MNTSHVAFALTVACGLALFATHDAATAYLLTNGKSSMHHSAEFRGHSHVYLRN